MFLKTYNPSWKQQIQEQRQKIAFLQCFQHGFIEGGEILNWGLENRVLISSAIHNYVNGHAACRWHWSNISQNKVQGTFWNGPALKSFLFE